LLTAFLQILAYVSGVMEVESNIDHASFTMEDVESNIVRCPDQEAAQKMIDGAQQQQQQQQSSYSSGRRISISSWYNGN
jgi:chorismate synthase